MAKGSTAKSVVEMKIQEAFGKNFLGIADKKLYVAADDGGEMVQIAIALTCPKNPVEFDTPMPAAKAPTASLYNDWSTPAEPPKPVMVTAREQDNIKTMLERLGL